MRVSMVLFAVFMVACEGDIEGVITEDATAPATNGEQPGAETGDDEADSSDEGLDDSSGDEQDSDDSTPVEELGELVGLELEIAYDSSVDGETVCDKQLSITGTPYTGDCDGCDFAFSIESTIVEDNSEPGCYLSDYRILNTRGTIRDVILGHADVLELGEGATAASYSDAVFVRYGVDGFAGTYGPYTRVLAHDDGAGDLGVFLRDGDAIEWGVETEDFTNGDDLLVDFCDVSYVSSWTDFELSGGFTTSSESVNCDGKKVDVWTIDVESSTTVGLAVDTVAAETAFDAKLIVIGADDCVEATADDNYPCTFAPDRYECPAIEVDLAPGQYDVLVHSMINVCREGVEMGEYTLTVDSDLPIRPSLEEDDILRYEQIPTTTNYEAEGRLIVE